MRAVLLEEFGSPLVVGEVPEPIAGPGQVLVRVMASGVNPLDIKLKASAVRRGGPSMGRPKSLPAILGMDVAGIVEGVGPGVTGFAPGDEVYGLVGGVGDLQGTLAPYVAADARLLAHKPSSLSMREAAALPLVVITAWEGLVDRARVGAGHKVLIHGAAGGIGHVAVQVARARGAEVFGTASSQRLPDVVRLGGTAVDRATPVEEYVAEHTGGEGFDIILDTAGGATLDASFGAVRAYTGHVLSALGWGTHSLAPLSFRGATYSGIFTLAPMLTGRGRERHGEILREAASLVDAGQLRPVLDPRHFTLDTAPDAHNAVANHEASGKVVVDVV
ncbi:zinc-dependent alcohol dehydrogenase family protein [Streptomyces sp. NPDC006923]|uniref:zinc-dependent alcohol dehydrogenase family protein n=1 Tax=Streptomyces sp. NPDC006923 TaxID=3155355 RepID=UPI0033F7A39E